MSELEQQIRDYVMRSGYKPVTAKGLAKKLGVRKKSMPPFREALERLIERGDVRAGEHGLLRPRQGPGLMAGIIKRISSGAGFFIPHDKPAAGPDGDLYITPRDMHDAHTGDEVLVRLLQRRGRGGRRCGRVEEIIERATNTFVGTYFEAGGDGWVQVDGNTIAEPVYVGDPGAKGAQPDDKVVIEMLRFPTHVQSGEAVVTKVLGRSGEPEVDTLSVIHEFALPLEFPDAVFEEARLQAQQWDETHLQNRRDLTRETIVTIDPADARDFDDAISLRRSQDGHWHLGVHIADVSHFVQPGSPLDEEARIRGNSAYLPGRVIPMLPELLSNGLASLQKGKVRFTKTVFIEFTAAGIPVHTEFVNSAIKVTRRFAYEEVLPIVREADRAKTRVSAKVRSLLVRMHELAMILRRRRFDAGALELDLREVKVDLDKDGRVSGAHEVAHDESHQIIEEFMLAANMAVAQELTDRGIPFLRRVHGDPDILKLRNFSEFVTALGYPLKRYQSRQDLQVLLNRVQGTPHEHAVNYALLRSLKQAEYSGEELGHYALAVDNYCHFTSPIRRYPDLTVHRLLDGIFRGKRKPPGPRGLELEKIGRHCSMTERRADDAERELTKIKLLRYMAERVGEEMEAVITGVESFGIFCQGLEIPVEGRVHISALDGGDYFDHDRSTFSLVGRRSGKQYRLGDRIRVAVAMVDVDRRLLELRVVPQETSSATGRSRNTSTDRRPNRSKKQREPSGRAKTGRSRRSKTSKRRKR